MERAKAHVRSYLIRCGPTNGKTESLLISSLMSWPSTKHAVRLRLYDKHSLSLQHVRITCVEERRTSQLRICDGHLVRSNAFASWIKNQSFCDPNEKRAMHVLQKASQVWSCSVLSTRVANASFKLGKLWASYLAREKSPLVVPQKAGWDKRHTTGAARGAMQM
jgi:hypothetical protein